MQLITEHYFSIGRGSKEFHGDPMCRAVGEDGTRFRCKVQAMEPGLPFRCPDMPGKEHSYAETSQVMPLCMVKAPWLNYLGPSTKTMTTLHWIENQRLLPQETDPKIGETTPGEAASRRPSTPSGFAIIIRSAEWSKLRRLRHLSLMPRSSMPL